MKPEAADYLDKARHCLASAKTIAAAGVPDVAARGLPRRLPWRRGIHFRVHRQGGQNASRRQKPVQPTGTTGDTDRPRSPHLSGGGLSILWRRAINSKPSPITASAPLSIRFPPMTQLRRSLPPSASSKPSRIAAALDIGPTQSRLVTNGTVRTFADHWRSTRVFESRSVAGHRPRRTRC